jgi:hypothetical protein
MQPVVEEKLINIIKYYSKKWQLQESEVGNTALRLSS